MSPRAKKPGDGKDAEGPADPPVIPDRSSDDSDEGWDRSGSGDSDESDDERYLRDRPPHW